MLSCPTDHKHRPLNSTDVFGYGSCRGLSFDIPIKHASVTKIDKREDLVRHNRMTYRC